MVPPTLVIKLWLKKTNFHILDFFSETKRQMVLHIMLGDYLDLGHYYLLNSTYRHFGRTLKIEKCKNLVSVYKTIENRKFDANL